MMMSATMHPIWQTGFVILLLAIAGALLLQSLTHRFVSAPLRRDHTALGGAIFSVIGTTYAVLLAFMATTAWEQYSAAQALARHEADVIGGMYRVSFGVPDPTGAAIRTDLAGYLVHVIETEWPEQIAEHPVMATEPMLADLDRQVVGLKPADATQSNVQSFLIGALSDVETARRDRRLAAHGTIPHLVWTVLILGGVFVTAFSFMLGAPTAAVHLLMTAALVASGVLVLLLIIGLSSPFHGAVTISPSAYEMVLAEIRAGP